MDNIAISQAKAIRETLGATHLVIFAVGTDGVQHVATHGDTKVHAQQAAQAGNNLKTALGWPADLCSSMPLARECEHCVFWKADYGTHCFNGWSGDGSVGWCRWEPKHVQTRKDDLCGHFEPNA